ncbi:MAG: hypothetical protein ACRC0F_08050, partial [Cetobacterium sp.]
LKIYLKYNFDFNSTKYYVYYTKKPKIFKFLVNKEVINFEEAFKIISEDLDTLSKITTPDTNKARSYGERRLKLLNNIIKNYIRLKEKS